MQMGTRSSYPADSLPVELAALEAVPCRYVRWALALVPHVAKMAKGAAQARAEFEDRPVLAVGPRTMWVIPPGGERVSLQARPPARRILAALIARSERDPESRAGVHELHEAGWPDQEAAPEVAAQRVYTTVWRLRRSGLAKALLRRDGGYMINADLQIERRI